MKEHEGCEPAASAGAAWQVDATYYTDPLCSWSWALEPHWVRLRMELGPLLRWRTRMIGMIPSWQSFTDPLNSVARPGQMALQWYLVRQQVGTELDERIWHEDPPASSYPACVAVKAAELQGQEVGERYLRRCREAVMLERRNIARPEVLDCLAQEVAAAGLLDFARFQQDRTDRAVDAFREDIREVRYHDIGRVPALIMRGVTGPAILLVGYRPYDALLRAVAHLAPGLEEGRLGADNPVRTVG